MFAEELLEAGAGWQAERAVGTHTDRQANRYPFLVHAPTGRRGENISVEFNADARLAERFCI